MTSPFLKSAALFLCLASTVPAQDEVELGSATGEPGDDILLPMDIRRGRSIVAAHLVLKYTPGHVRPGTPIMDGGGDHEVDFFDDGGGSLGIIISSPANALIPSDAMVLVPLELLDGSPSGGPSIEMESLTFTEASGARFAASPVYHPIEQWRRDHFTAAEREDAGIIGDDRDPDLDTIPNLVELAAGLDPKSPGPIFLSGPAPGAGAGAGRTISIRFQRANDPMLSSAVWLFPETGNDLIDWTTAGITETSLGSPVPGVEVFEAVIEVLENASGFLRLRAERTE